MSSIAYIRIATIDDLAVLLQIEQACEEAAHWSEDSWRSVLQEAVDLPSWRRVLIAERDAVAVGYVVLAGAGDTAELESVVVSSAFRSQGLGKSLCVAAMTFAAQRGVKQMQLEVRAANYVPRSLYASLGFVEQGTRKGYYRDPVEDAVLMSAALRCPEV